mmetsp:Transcript_30671/g.98849  ORF Transcript_30671/g.98849 Transcript_30671/m.98849 type:complete len:208 (+) Transcript_30671:961-1584(+)
MTLSRTLLLFSREPRATEADDRGDEEAVGGGGEAEGQVLGGGREEDPEGKEGEADDEEAQVQGGDGEEGEGVVDEEVGDVARVGAPGPYKGDVDAAPEAGVGAVGLHEAHVIHGAVDVREEDVGVVEDQLVPLEDAQGLLVPADLHRRRDENVGRHRRDQVRDGPRDFEEDVGQPQRHAGHPQARGGGQREVDPLQDPRLHCEGDEA